MGVGVRTVVMVALIELETDDRAIHMPYLPYQIRLSQLPS